MQLNYESMNGVLTQLAEDLDSSESHGVLCGLLCINPDQARSGWTRYILEQISVVDQAAEAKQVGQVLEPLLVEAQGRLNSVECDFQPILPESDTLSVRTQALAKWVQGFLVGMSFGGVKDLKDLPSDSMEIMQDMVKIAQAGRYAVTESNEDEAAYSEILEYLRAGTMLIYQEHNSPEPTVPPGNAVH